MFFCKKNWKLKELTARDAAAKILKLTDQIQKETEKLRPLMKILNQKKL